MAVKLNSDMEEKSLFGKIMKTGPTRLLLVEIGRI